MTPKLNYLIDGAAVLRSYYDAPADVSGRVTAPATSQPLSAQDLFTMHALGWSQPGVAGDDYDPAKEWTFGG